MGCSIFPIIIKNINAHINVEYCSSVKAIKYICKYVNKDSDMAVFGLQSEIKDIDEIVQFQAGRYISSNESVKSNVKSNEYWSAFVLHVEY